MDNLASSPNELSHELAHALCSSMPVPLSCWNTEGFPIYCTNSFFAFFGVKNIEDYIHRIRDFSPLIQPSGEESATLGALYLEKALEEGYCHFSWTHTIRPHTRTPVEYTLVRMELDGKAIVASYLYDMSVTVASYEQEAEAKIRAQTLLDASPMSISFWTKDFIPIDCNKETLRLFKFQSRNEYFANVFNIFPEYQPDGKHSQTEVLVHLQKAFDEGYCKFEWIYQSFDGESIPTEATLKRVKYLGEDLLALYVQDIREIRTNQEKARAAEQYAQTMLDSLPLGADLWNKNHELVAVNERSVRLFGLSSRQEYIERFNEFSPQTQPCGNSSDVLIAHYLNTAFAEGSCCFEWMHVDSLGKPMPVELTLIRVEYRGEELVAAYNHDLRSLKASQEQTREAENRASIMLDSVPMGAIFLDKENNRLDCNMVAVTLFGFESKEDYLLNAEKTYPPVQPDCLPSEISMKEHFDVAFKSGAHGFQWICCHQKTQESIPVEISMVRINFRGEPVILCYLRDLREYNAMLQEIHQTENDLRTARDIAEQSTKAKSEFLANMSHEIRTPMNGILGLLELLKKADLEKLQRTYVEKALFSANNLLRIINDILDFSKIEAGKLEMEYIPFSIRDICDEVRHLFMPKMTEKKLALHLMTQGFDDITLMGDPLRLKQVLFNLVSNAIKFTEEGGVTVTFEKRELVDNEVHCYFSVRDTGIGLTDEQRVRLFSAFSQADTSVTRKYGGTGLGLVISKRIVEMMGGSVGVESSYGEGSTFYFTAIFTLCHFENTRLAQNTGTYREDSISYNASADEIDMANALDSMDIPDDTATALPAVEFSQLYVGHILLVEDNDINQLIAEELLKAVGHTVEIANNGQEALDLLSQKTFDLVLMDIQMPIMDGLTAVKRIRAQKAFQSLPVIAMSAHAMEGDKEISLTHGMNDHITKPISQEILYGTLEYWLKKSFKNNMLS